MVCWKGRQIRAPMDVLPDIEDGAGRGADSASADGAAADGASVVDRTPGAGHQAVVPPSMAKSAPVTHDDSSEAR